MIDRIRQDIQDRLDQLLSEADRLRHALAALGGDGDGETGGQARAARSETSRRTRSRSASSGGSRSGGTASRARSANGSGGGRAAAGGTKNAVLQALSEADGKAMTATEVAAATGLGRASVSTTLSKLARAGDVEKAARGYQLTGAGAASGDGNGAGETAED